MTQNKLGVSHDKGKGVEQDPKEALQRFRKAADQGDAQAQYKLGLMYYNGEGIEKDPKEAVEWFRKAANQGLAQGAI